MVVAVLEILQMQALQHGIDACFGFSAAEHVVERGEHHILVHRRHEHLVVGVLEHKAEFSADFRQGIAADLGSVHQDFPLPFQQAEQKLHDRGLAGTVCADQPHGLAGVNAEGQVFQDRNVLLVCKTHMLKFNHFFSPH